MLEFTKWILFGGLGLAVGFFALQKPFPKIDTNTCANADIWARNIEESIDKKAWDRTDVVMWTFANNNHIWDKKRKLHILQSNKKTTIQSLH